MQFASSYVNLCSPRHGSNTQKLSNTSININKTKATEVRIVAGNKQLVRAPAIRTTVVDRRPDVGRSQVYHR